MKPASTEQRLPESSWSTTERWCMIVEMEMLFGSRLRTQVLVARRPRSRVQARNRLELRSWPSVFALVTTNCVNDVEIPASSRVISG
jgi:hypothetical protein